MKPKQPASTIVSIELDAKTIARLNVMGDAILHQMRGEKLDLAIATAIQAGLAFFDQVQANAALADKGGKR